MKKTFFTTQLESFFSSITQEFSEKINALELEKNILQDKNNKLEIDINALTKIRTKLTNELEDANKEIKELTNELIYTKNVTTDEQNLELIRENNKLKEQIKSDDITLLKQKIANLQNFIQKGGSGYNQTLLEQKNEDIVKEINKNLKK